MVSGLTEILTKTAKQARVKVAKNKKNKIENPPWFDKSCEKLKSEIKSLGKKIRGDPHNFTLKEQLSASKRKLKKEVKKNKWTYKNALIQKMSWSVKESKTFWKLLDKLDKKRDDNIFKEGISGDRWVSHFESIFNTKKGKSSKPAFPPNTKERGHLDYEITSEEIKLGSYILRNGKTPGYDSISNEMVLSLLSVKPEVIKTVFNTIFKTPKSVIRIEYSHLKPKTPLFCNKK